MSMQAAKCLNLPMIDALSIGVREIRMQSADANRKSTR